MNKRLAPKKWYGRAVHKTPDWAPLNEDTPPVHLISTLPAGVKITAVGVVLPDGLDFEQWVAVGNVLIAMKRCVLWALAEWWAFGHHEYGAKEVFAKELGFDFGYLSNLGWVARSVPTSSRNEALSFAHHMKVAKLAPQEQKEWLEKAAKEEWSVVKLEQQIKDEEKDDRTEDDAKLKEKDPEGYRIGKAHEAAAKATFHLGKVSNPDIHRHFQAITTDPDFLADLDDRVLARLTNVASGVAEMFNEIVSALKQEQGRRAAKADEATDEDQPEAATKPATKRVKREYLPVERAQL